jgi:hypothetical protein
MCALSTARTVDETALVRTNLRSAPVPSRFALPTVAPSSPDVQYTYATARGARKGQDAERQGQHRHLSAASDASDDLDVPRADARCARAEPPAA